MGYARTNQTQPDDNHGMIHPRVDFTVRILFQGTARIVQASR
nr:MAG TPA: hypothetical protein [Caudoviricetes sp.]